ncbi:hypothetical protein AAG906_019089 [Vitis piasezkii]
MVLNFILVMILPTFKCMSFSWIHFEAMLGHVIWCTSTEIWSTLYEVFGIQSKARILQPVNNYNLRKVILYILSGLGIEYESVVVNITFKDHITLQRVIAHYVAKENSFNSGYNRGNGNYGQPRGSRGGGGEGNQSKNKPIYQSAETGHNIKMLSSV